MVNLMVFCKYSYIPLRDSITFGVWITDQDLRCLIWCTVERASRELVEICSFGVTMVEDHHSACSIISLQYLASQALCLDLQRRPSLHKSL